MSATVPHVAGAGTRPPLLRRSGWLLLFIALTVVGLATGVAAGASIVQALFPPVTALLLIGLMRVLPPGLPALDPLAGRTRAQTLAEARPLLVYALLFPLLLIPVVVWLHFQYLPLIPGQSAFWALSWNYLVVGKIGLLLLPTVWFTWRLGGDARRLGLRGIGGAWRWAGPIAVLIVYTALSGVDLLGVSVPALSVWRAVATVAVVILAAGLTEELFYRVLLQTRLEVLLGRWNGIAVTALLFALLHVPSRFAFVYLGRTGVPAADLAIAFLAMVTMKGAAGLVFGYLWTRYRNAWINVIVHTAVDSIPLVLIAAGAAVQGS
jgi:membrane protease YdiL (CAAX protease family)